MAKKIVTHNDYTKYPFREKVQITPERAIQVWRNADFSETLYQFIRKIAPNIDGTERWEVMAQFLDLTEFWKYMRKKKFSNSDLPF